MRRVEGEGEEEEGWRGAIFIRREIKCGLAGRRVGGSAGWRVGGSVVGKSVRGRRCCPWRFIIILVVGIGRHWQLYNRPSPSPFPLPLLLLLLLLLLLIEPKGFTTTRNYCVILSCLTDCVANQFLIRHFTPRLSGCFSVLGKMAAAAAAVVVVVVVVVVGAVVAAAEEDVGRRCPAKEECQLFDDFTSCNQKCHWPMEAHNENQQSFPRWSRRHHLAAVIYLPSSFSSVHTHIFGPKSS